MWSAAEQAAAPMAALMAASEAAPQVVALRAAERVVVVTEAGRAPTLYSRRRGDCLSRAGSGPACRPPASRSTIRKARCQSAALRRCCTIQV